MHRMQIGRTPDDMIHAAARLVEQHGHDAPNLHIVEGVLLLVFAVPLWAGAVDSFPGAQDNPIQVRVIAQQFAWNVFYPGPDGKFGDTKMSFITPENPWGQDKADPASKDEGQAAGKVDYRSLFMVPTGMALAAVLLLAAFFRPPERGPVAEAVAA